MALGGNGTAVRECAAAAWLRRVEDEPYVVDLGLNGED
jgi:hypothetical protein